MGPRDDSTRTKDDDETKVTVIRLGNKHGSGAARRSRLSEYNLQKEISHVVNTIEVEIPRAIKKTAQREGTYHLGEDQPGDRTHQDPADSAH